MIKQTGMIHRSVSEYFNPVPVVTSPEGLDLTKKPTGEPIQRGYIEYGQKNTEVEGMAYRYRCSRKFQTCTKITHHHQKPVKIYGKGRKRPRD